ncbi:hypothetical protein NFI96_025838 [Prochilodus magdalenae]|nr:hypothetical protein NFI96_025838 [Prochilodus magdalenae]
MNDQSLSREIQELLQSEKHSEEKLSPGQCLALAYMVLSSGDELDLKKMDGCSFIKDTWETLCSAIQSTNSSLKDLDLSNNHLGDTRVELLSAGLKSVHCKLEILRLAGCHLTITSCEKLSSSLQSVNTCLKALDLSDDDLQDSGVELLASELNSHCKLEILRLADCHLTTTSCEKVASSLQTVNSYLKELDLSNNDLQDSGVELFSVGLKSSHCKLEKLKLAFCKFGGKICEHLGSALQSVHSLKELDLSYNDLEDSGVKLLCDGLRSSNCLLEILR